MLRNQKSASVGLITQQTEGCVLVRLKLSYESKASDLDTWYVVLPDLVHSNLDPATIDEEMERLASRIRLVGFAVLGNNLKKVCTKKFPGYIGLCFKAGKNLRFRSGVADGPKASDLRDFFGWIKIFDVETVVLQHTIRT